MPGGVGFPLIARLDRALLAPAPATRLAVVRIVVGLFLVGTNLGLLPATLTARHLDLASFDPVGLVSPWPRPPLPAFALAVHLAAIVGAAAFALGWRHRLTGPAAAVLFLWVSSYRSSWGMIFHSENLLALHALVLALAPAADALSLDARRGRSAAPVGDAREAPSVGARYGWPLSVIALVTVASYFLAGVAKLRAEGLGWAAGEFLLNQVAHDNVRKAELGAMYSPLGGYLLAHPALFKPLAALSLALEALAPLALLGRRLLQIWAIAVVGFHLGILALMAVAFPYPLTGAAFVAFFPAERAAEKVIARWRQRGSTSSRSGTG